MRNRLPFLASRPGTIVAAAALLAVLGASAPPPAMAQTFDFWMSPWGPGRKSSGEFFHSAVEHATQGPFRLRGETDWSLAVGAQYFVRMESRDNRDLTSSVRDSDTFADHRARLSVRASYQGRVGFLLELQDVRIWGTERTTVTNDPFVGLQQAFVDLRVTRWLDLRVGRQEISYGEDRLLGNLDWAQASRSFDGAFLRFTPAKSVTIDAFGMLVRERMILTDPSGGSLPNAGAQLFGIYGRWRPSRRAALDLYALGLTDDPTAPAIGPRGSRAFATLGGRGLARIGPMEFMAEAAAQMGSHLEGDLRAWAIATRVKATAPVWGNPYFSFEYLRASGDGDPTDGVYHTFNQLFPTAHVHLGYADLVAWQNVQDFRFTAGFRPWGLHLWVDIHKFQLADARGAWFDAGGRVFQAADPTRTSNDMGTEVDISLTWPVHKYFAVAGAYTIFVPGSAARGSDASHWGFLYLRSQF